MQAEVRTGPAFAADGSILPARGGKSGEVSVGDAHARYMEAVYRGNVFTASNQAGTAVTNLAATATGLILTNPLGSGKNLVLLEILFAQTSVAAAAANALVLAANINPAAAAVTHTTPITPRNALLGGAVGVGLVDGAATLPAAPIVIRALTAPSVSATATTSAPPFLKDEVAGAIILAPGTAISLSSTAAFSGIGTFTWEEIPV